MNNNLEIKKIEEPVIELLLKGDHPILLMLYQQWKNSEIEKVELTGVGFFINYKTHDDAPALKGAPSFELGDVKADLGGLQHGMGFVLFVKNGRITVLEGYTFDEPWPENIEDLKVSYLNDHQRDLDRIPAGD